MVRRIRYSGLPRGRLPAWARCLSSGLALALIVLLPVGAPGQSPAAPPAAATAEPPTFPRTFDRQPAGNGGSPCVQGGRDIDESGGADCDAGAPCRPGLWSGICSRLSPPGGVEGPISRESWLRRPFSISWFIGAVEGSPLISDWVGEADGLFGGVRLGWDFDHCWGTEMRFAVGSIGLYDSRRAQDAQWFADTQNGYAPDDPYRQRYDGGRNASVLLWDLNLLVYPWGDHPWRPYLLAGLGTCAIGFEDRFAVHRSAILFGMPVGMGIKYHCSDALALRFDIADNVAFGGSGVNTLHQVSITGGIEYRFGGARKSYWPWNPARSY
jgi:hypothetical protein